MKTIDARINFDYDTNATFSQGSDEYDLLEDLSEEEDWVAYLDEMAQKGLTVEYNLVEDEFKVFS